MGLICRSPPKKIVEKCAESPSSCSSPEPEAGASTQGGNGARCTMAKIGGGDFVTIMMLSLVSIIIYYYMNTFITLHQCTFNLLFALFSTLCLKKTSPIFLAITRESIVGFS